MKHDIAQLESRIKSFDEKMDQGETLFSKLGPIIHNPGWTTLVEFNLVMLTIDAMEHHANGIKHLRTNLLKAAKQIDDGPNTIKPPAGTPHGGSHDP